MKTIIGLVLKVVGGMSLLLSLPSLAHHSFAAAYDENSPLNMEGVVTKVELTNPHSWLWVDVTNEDGTVTNWGFEGGPPVNLFRNGISKDTLPVGSEIKVFAYQARVARAKALPFSLSTLTDERYLWVDQHPAPTVTHDQIIADCHSRSEIFSQVGVSSAT